MSVYNVNDLEKMWSYSTSMERQNQLLYQMYQSLKGTVSSIEGSIADYTQVRGISLQNQNNITALQGQLSTVIKTLNQLIDHLKCYEAGVESRLEALEGKSLQSNADGLTKDLPNAIN